MPMYQFKKESNKNVVSVLGLKTGNSLMRLKIAKYVIRHRMAKYPKKNDRLRKNALCCFVVFICA